jgi:antitoxin CcdA
MQDLTPTLTLHNARPDPDPDPDLLTDPDLLLSIQGEPMRQKLSCNTSIDKSLLKQAKDLDIKLSAVFETALEDAVREEKQRRWLADNAEAIKWHNARVREQGTFSEKIGPLN